MLGTWSRYSTIEKSVEMNYSQMRKKENLSTYQLILTCLPSIHPSTYYLLNFPSIHPFIHLSIHPSFYPYIIYVPTHYSITHPCINPSTHLPTFHLSISSLSYIIYPPAYLSTTHPFAHLLAHSLIHLFVCPSLHLISIVLPTQLYCPHLIHLL